LPDEESWVSALPVVDTLLATRAPLLKYAAGEGLKAELVVGVTVGSSESFAPSLDFPPALLSSLAAANLALTVIAYPTADE